MDIILENIIVGKSDTNANWTSDLTVHPLGFFMISSDEYYTGTTVKKWKIANGVDTWTNIDFVPVAETLAQILVNGNTTGGNGIESDNAFSRLKVLNAEVELNFNDGSISGGLKADATKTEIKHTNQLDLDSPSVVLKQSFLNSLSGDSYLSMLPTYTKIEFSGNRKGSYHFLDDNEIYLSWLNTLSNINGKVLINTTNTKLEHTNLIEFTAPSVTKNGYEIATENFVDQRIQSNIKIIGDWDASSGSYPLADESNTTPFIAQWGATMKVGWAFRVGYGQAGTVDGFYYENGDVVYALIDSPTDDSSSWGDLDHNLQQSTESLRGTAKITTTAIIEDETTLDNETIVTPNKFWSKAIPKFKLLANTWNLLQTFTNGIKTTLFTNDDGEFKFKKTVDGNILIWTNGQHFRFSATSGGAPSMEIDKTTGKIKLLDEIASKPLTTNADKGITSGDWGTTAGTFAQGNDARFGETITVGGASTNLAQNTTYNMGQNISLAVATNTTSRAFKFQFAGTLTDVNAMISVGNNASNNNCTLELRNITQSTSQTIGNVNYGGGTNSNTFFSFSGLNISVNTSNVYTVRVITAVTLATAPTGTFHAIRLKTKY